MLAQAIHPRQISRDNSGCSLSPLPCGVPWQLGQIDSVRLVVRFEGQPIPKSVINRVVAGLVWPVIRCAISTVPPELQLLSSVHGHPGRATSEALALLCGMENYRLRN
jgi:hypothetical protein